MLTWTTTDTKEIFTIDVEARPGPWAGSDFTFRHMLSIAGAVGDEYPSYLGPGFTPEALDWFIQPMREGCLVVTHNGPKYDLPFLNGTLVKMGLRPLDTLLVSDTYAHLIKRGSAFSASLGNMAKRFGLDVAKGSMGEVDWERAYDGDPDALAQLRLYNETDVVTTRALREKLLSLGLLGPPRRWVP